MRASILGVLQDEIKVKRGINVFYDFTRLPEANGATITTVTDQMGNFNATGVNSPVCEEFTFNGDTIKSFKDEGNKHFNMGTTGITLANKSFEVWIVFSSTDGRMASSIQLFGARGADVNRTFLAFINTTGDISIAYGYNGVTRFSERFPNFLADGSIPISLIRIRVNFEADVVLFYLNGEQVGGSIQDQGPVSALNPALFDQPNNILLGNLDANGSVSTNTTASNFYQVYFTDKLAGPSSSNLQDVMVENSIMKDILSRYTQWQNELGVTLANISAKRADMIDYIFNGNGLPANETPTSINTNYTGSMHGVALSGITGEGTVVQTRWDVTDGDAENWANYIYFIPNATPTNNWMIEHRGHGSEGTATHTTAINRAIAEGYNVIFMGMPLSDPDTDGQNTTSNPAASAGHEALYEDGIDTVSYNALELFFSSQVQAINYLFANYTVESLYGLGLSGGAYTLSILAAIDTRITKTIADRGFMPRSAKYYPFYKSGFEPDFEQGGANGLQVKCGPRVYQFFTDHPQLEIMAMCTDGGRVYGTMTHTNDSSIFYGYTWLAWKNAMKSKAVELGGRYFQYLNKTDGESVHAYQPTELDRAFYEFSV